MSPQDALPQSPRYAGTRPATVAVVGATGAVGTEMLRVLETRGFPVRELRLLASRRSAGTTMAFRGEAVAVAELGEAAFEGVDIALFSAGGERSRLFAPAAVRAGAVVIDNSSAFRMAPDVPLVVPEINGYLTELRKSRDFVANNREYFDRSKQAVLANIQQNEAATEALKYTNSPRIAASASNVPDFDKIKLEKSGGRAAE